MVKKVHISELAPNDVIVVFDTENDESHIININKANLDALSSIDMKDKYISAYDTHSKQPIYIYFDDAGYIDFNVVLYKSTDFDFELLKNYNEDNHNEVIAEAIRFKNAVMQEYPEYTKSWPKD